MDIMLFTFTKMYVIIVISTGKNIFLSEKKGHCKNMKNYSFYIILLLCVFSSHVVKGEESRTLHKVEVPPAETIIERGKQYLLIIGIGKYDTWPALENPVKDAKEIKDILQSRYFIDPVIEIYDAEATKANIIRTFNTLRETLSIDDSLLILYFGHGHFDTTTNSGFWIPVNAGKDEYAQENWLPNSQIRGFITGIKATHLCIMSDSCFSGDLLDTGRGMTDDEKNNVYFSKAYAKVSRQVITSGAAEIVPDNSEFAVQLKHVLRKNTSPYLDPYMIYSEIRLGITKTTPLVGNLKETGHQEGASFLLFLKEEKKDTPEIEEKKSIMTEPEIAEPHDPYFFSAGLRMEVSVPVGKVEEALGAGYYPTTSLFWNTGFVGGTLGIGILSGMNYMEEAEDYEVSFSLFSFPLFFLLRYSFPADYVISGFIEAGGGGMINLRVCEENKVNIRPAFSVSCGIRVKPARQWYIGVYGNFLVNFLGNYLYTGICPGLLCEIKI
jgi:hypothetical protein